ncbi:hypothetical protein L249_0634, partial [Ophiocordyceps polyrhachis-furcata BCC 54312]
TRPEGLGGSRDAGPAAAGPRPPYVTEAERHNNVGGGYGTATPYSGYGRTGRTGQQDKQGVPSSAIQSASVGGEDEGPAPADLATFFFLPTAGESTADSTLFFFDLCGRYGYGYGYGKRPRCYSSSTASSFPLERSLRPDFFGCFFRPLVFRPFLPSLFFLRVEWLPFFVAPPCLRQIQVLTEDLPWPAAKTALLRYYGAFNQIRTVGFYDKLRRHEARRPKTKDTIDWLEKHAFLCRKGLGGSRDAGPAAAGPRPPYVTEAVRYSGCGYGTATPYSGYGRTGRTGQQDKQGVPSLAIQSASV